MQFFCYVELLPITVHAFTVQHFLFYRYKTTVLLLTAISGTLDALQYLLSLGANWKKIDSMENNIIHLAVLYFHTHILKYIIELNIPELNVWQHLVGKYNHKF